MGRQTVCTKYKPNVKAAHHPDSIVWNRTVRHGFFGGKSIKKIWKRWICLYCKLSWWEELTVEYPKIKREKKKRSGTE